MAPLSDRLFEFNNAALFRLYRLFLTGVEVTQAIQHYGAAEHLTDTADRGADNSLRLVVDKPAWVRVYVAGRRLPAVTGTVEVFRRSNGFLWGSLGTLNPQPPGTVTAVANPDYATQRGTLSETLNFIIPREWMCGNLRLVARVQAGRWNDDADHDIGRAAAADVAAGRRDDLLQRPGEQRPERAEPADRRADAGRPPGDVGAGADNVSGARDGQVQNGEHHLVDRHLQDTVRSPPGARRTGMRCMPRSSMRERLTATRPGGCTTACCRPASRWARWVGAVAAASAWGRSAQAARLAHEIAHACGLEHAPCGGAPRPDPNYPTYEP